MKLKNPKAKGSRQELKVKQVLENLGFRVIKSGGSFGPADLVAIKQDEQKLVQVKSSKWPSKKEMHELKMLAQQLPNWKVEIVRIRNRKGWDWKDVS